MKAIKVAGKQNFMGVEIPVVLGGFGEDKKCISDKTIAEIHSQPVPEIRRRITDNIKRFDDGIDLIDLKKVMGEGHDNMLFELEYTQMQISKAEHIYILSERGYAKLIKIMDTDLAWEIHDKLMDEYFVLREEKVKMDNLSPQLQLMINMELEQKRQAREIEAVKENQKAITQALTREPAVDFRTWVSNSLSMIAESDAYPYLGDRQGRHQAVRAESYERLNAKRPCRLDQKVRNAKGNAATAGATKTQINGINKLTVIESDKDLRPVYEAVIREMLIAYKVQV